MKCPCEDEMYICETPCNRDSCAYNQGKADARAEVIDECIDIVRNTYRMDALEKLEQLKEQNK